MTALAVTQMSPRNQELLRERRHVLLRTRPRRRLRPPRPTTFPCRAFGIAGARIDPIAPPQVKQAAMIDAY